MILCIHYYILEHKNLSHRVLYHQVPICVQWLYTPHHCVVQWVCTQSRSIDLFSYCFTMSIPCCVFITWNPCDEFKHLTSQPSWYSLITVLHEWNNDCYSLLYPTSLSKFCPAETCWFCPLEICHLGYESLTYTIVSLSPGFAQRRHVRSAHQRYTNQDTNSWLIVHHCKSLSKFCPMETYYFCPPGYKPLT